MVVQVTGTNWPRPAYTLLITGLCRFRIDEILQETPYPVARVTQLDKLPGEESGMLRYIWVSKFRNSIGTVNLRSVFFVLTVSFLMRR